MARRGIDMLPLLDVFMVVLFVFATIQEQQLDTSVQELDDKAAALAEAEAKAARQATLIEQLEAELRELEAASEELEQSEAELRERIAEYERVNPDAKVQAEMATLHERLLDNVAVFEIELEGDPDLSTGEIRNRCCYRADPPNGPWRGCGQMPTAAEAQLAWLDEGADGLVDGLSRTRGGNAVVLLSQGNLARHRVSNDLAELLRERFPNHRVYDDGTTAGPPECPLLER